MNEVRNLKPQILVIDDEKKMCITLKQLLEKNDFSVSIAHAGIGRSRSWFQSCLTINSFETAGFVTSPDTEEIIIRGSEKQLEN